VKCWLATNGFCKVTSEAPCAVCDSEVLKPWRWAGLQRCGSCGYVRKAISPNGHTPESLQEAYFDENFAQDDDFFVRFYEKQNARRRLSQIVRFKKGGAALEVGVGRGTLLATLRERGFQVEGLELSEAVRSYVARQTGIAIHSGKLSSLAARARTGRYDVIVMSHVLEHIDDLRDSLAAIGGLLNPDGILYLAVPNVSCWNSHLPGWTGYEPYHVHYFQMGSLKRLLETAGFRVLKASTFEPLSGWFNAFTRSLRHTSPDLRPSTNSGAGPSSLLKSAYNVGRLAFGGLTSPLRWVQAAIGRGEELVIVATPSR
jgi:2-polyprenyl-3-methyl-5-hydroxy-6-metoxy-1,4-benzoquinol methylase